MLFSTKFNSFCMKKLLFSLFLLISALFLNAQITITSADLPSGGDTLRYSLVNTTDTLITKNYKKTGINYTWDFQN